MSLGLFFIILHSTLPHNHTFTQETSFKSQNEIDNIFEAIVNIDLGISHLENIKNQDIVVIVFMAVFLEFNLFFENKNISYNDNYTFNYQSQLIPKNNLLRGPPLS